MVEDLFDLPDFPSPFGEKEQARLKELEAHKKRMEEVYQAKFTPEAWARVPAPERAIRRFLPGTLFEPFVRAVTPWDWGWDYGMAPEQARARLIKAETEIKELGRRQRVFSVLPQVQEALRALALSDEDIVTGAEELNRYFKLAEIGFNEEDIAYVMSYAQSLLRATPEELISGEPWGIRPITEEEIEQLARQPLFADPRYLLSTIALSKDAEQIQQALQMAYPPQVAEEDFDTRRDRILRTYIEGLQLKEGESISDATTRIFGEISEEMGELITLTNTETGEVSTGKRGSDGTVYVWTGGEHMEGGWLPIGRYDPETGAIVPIAPDTGESLTTEVDRGNWLERNIWNPLYSGVKQLEHGIGGGALTIIQGFVMAMEQLPGKPFPGQDKLLDIVGTYIAERQEDWTLKYQKWLTDNPQMQPRAAYLESPIENPSLLKDPGYWGYLILNQAPIIVTAYGVGIVTGISTGNPLLGAVAAAAVITPLEITAIRDDLIAEGVDLETANDLSLVFGSISGAVEILPAYIFFKIVNPAAARVFKREVRKQLIRQTVKGLTARGLLFTEKKVAGDVLAIAATEVSEEVIQEILQNAAVKMERDERDLFENVPEIAIQAAISMSPLFVIGGGASYLNIRANMPPRMQEEMVATEVKMQEAGLGEDHAQAIALGKVLETEEGQAAVELAQEKVAEETPADLKKRATKITKLEKDLKLFNDGIDITKSSILSHEAREKGLAKPGLGWEIGVEREIIASLRENLEELEVKKTKLIKNLQKTKEVPAALKVTSVIPDVATRWDLISVPERTVLAKEANIAVSAGSKVWADLTSVQQERLLARPVVAPPEPAIPELVRLRISTEEVKVEFWNKLTIKKRTEIVKAVGLASKIGRKTWEDLSTEERTVIVPQAVEEAVEELAAPESPPLLEPDIELRAAWGTEYRVPTELPRTIGWETEQEGFRTSLAENPNVAKAIWEPKRIKEARIRARETWTGATAEQRKGITKELRLGKAFRAKEWSDMTPPEQATLTLAAIPNKSLHLSRAYEALDVVHYMRALQELTGYPFHNMFIRLRDGHGIARTKAENVIKRVGLDPLLAPVRASEESKGRVAQEINARNPRLKVDHPENLTPAEQQAVGVASGIFKAYQPKIRLMRVMRTTSSMEAFKREFPDAPEVELAIALELKKNDDMQGLWQFMNSVDWGVIREGYDPRMLQIPDLFPQEANLDTARGEARLMARETLDYQEQLMERDFFQRLVAYVTQVEIQWNLKDDIELFGNMWKQVGNKFDNTGRIEASLRQFMREFQGIPVEQSLGDLIVRRIWRQAMSTIFQHLWMPFRNIHQHFAFHPDRTELARLFIQPMPPALGAKGHIYYDTFVTQLGGIRREWLYVGERGIPGLTWLTRLADRLSLYAHSDNVPRRWTFLAALNKAQRATQEFLKDGNARKWIKGSGALHLTRTEQGYALKLLSQKDKTFNLGVGGLESVTGAERASIYVAHEIANQVHFIYERAFRGTVEMGATGRTLFNLIVFPRGYFQRITLMFQQAFSEEAVWTDPKIRDAFKQIVLLIAVGEIVSQWLVMVSGRRRRAYSPFDIIQWELGGLALGAVQDLQQLINDLVIVLTPGRDPESVREALGRLPTDLKSGARVQVPFYRHVTDSLDAIFDTKNIDLHYIKRLRAILDESFTVEELETMDRSLWEKMRKAVLGGDVLDPDRFTQIQLDLQEAKLKLGEIGTEGRNYTLSQFGGEIASLTKELPNEMLTEEYGFDPLVVFFKECEDKWKEYYQLPTQPAKLRNEWKESHIEEEAMMLFWGKLSQSVSRRGSPRWEEVAELLRVWFSFFEIAPGQHSEWADWTTGGLTSP